MGRLSAEVRVVWESGAAQAVISLTSDDLEEVAAAVRVAAEALADLLDEPLRHPLIPRAVRLVP